MSNRIYSRAVRERTIQAAQQLLDMVGCTVEYERLAYDTVNLRITIPPDSGDPHGDALRLAIADQESNAAAA